MRHPKYLGFKQLWPPDHGPGAREWSAPQIVSFFSTRIMSKYQDLSQVILKSIRNTIIIYKYKYMIISNYRYIYISLLITMMIIIIIPLNPRHFVSSASPPPRRSTSAWPNTKCQASKRKADPARWSWITSCFPGGSWFNHLSFLKKIIIYW